MRLSALARMHVVNKEEKEQRLKDFIGRDLALRKSCSDGAARGVYQVIALSPESPVARALAEVADEAAALGITIEAIFLRKPAAERAPDSRALPEANCRYTSDIRLLDAHEQLVLGPTTTWIGDCMRRDPGKRDAFECYSEDCATTSHRAACSFARLWSIAKPANRVTAHRDAGLSPQDVLDASLIASSEALPSPVALRH